MAGVIEIQKIKDSKDPHSIVYSIVDFNETEKPFYMEINADKKLISFYYELPLDQACGMVDCLIENAYLIEVPGIRKVPTSRATMQGYKALKENNFPTILSLYF